MKVDSNILSHLFTTRNYHHSSSMMMDNYAVEEDGGGHAIPINNNDMKATGKEQRQKMKEEQYRILSSQNQELLSTLDHAEEELETLQNERITLGEDNRTLHESNIHLQARTKSAETELADVKSNCQDFASQLNTMTTKNAELFNLLEREETNTVKITAELEVCRDESHDMGEKYTILAQSSRKLEETAVISIRENQLKADEIRVLRSEVAQLKKKNSELTIQSTVELDAVNEQLRLRKEKQYQLLGKLQSQEEASRHAEDYAKEMELNIKDLRQKSSELQTALQLETNARISQDNSKRTLSIDLQATVAENKELCFKLQEMEQHRLKLEAEARDNGDQLREMAEKVFQLLERLKLAELGKKKSMEALSKKEQELFVLKKQQAKIIEDNSNQRRVREKVEMEKRVVDDQLRGLKKVNSQLSQKLKEEAKWRIREEEASKVANDKVRTLDGRLAFLLNRLQMDEEERSAQQDEMKKMESQVQDVTQRCDVLQGKLTKAEQNARDANEKLQQSDKQLKESQIKHQATEESIKLQEEQAMHEERKAIQSKGYSSIAGGQQRFFVDNRPSLGYAVVTGKIPRDKVWLDERGANNFLRKVLKSQHNSQEPLVKKISELYGAILFGEEQLDKAKEDLRLRKEDVDRYEKELNRIQTDVYKEEETKRRILLRYIRAVKASVSLGEPGCEEDRKEVGKVGAGRINLPESSLGDEEVHVVAAMINDNVTIEEIQFRRNNIGDDGARALAAVLASRSTLKFVDLRENHISMSGVKVIADALERSERIHKVIVHPGGKIEGLGASTLNNGSDESTAFAAKSICIVDIREQRQPAKVKAAETKQQQQQKSAHNKRIVSTGKSQHMTKKVRASSADANRDGDGGRATA